MAANNRGLTQVLSPKDADLYRKIFEVQEKGQWKKADRLIAQLDNDALMGHVRAQRYLHPTAYRSKYTELRRWLSSYADHPQARQIYRLAAKRRPSGAAWPAKPKQMSLRFGPDTRKAQLVPKRRNATERRRVYNIKRKIKRYLGREMPTKALAYLNRKSTLNKLTRLEADDLRADIAASYYFEHVDEKALRLAGQVAERHRLRVPVADWTAGLAAYRMGKSELASYHFEHLAKSPNASPGLKSAGGYWAARAYLISGAPERVTKNLTIAAKSQTSFYGLLALRQLGQEPQLNWASPDPSDRDLIEAFALPTVRRAVALAQVGMAAEADEELRRGHGSAPDRLDEALLKIAGDNKLAAAELHIAEAIPGRPFHSGLYPIPAYQPKGGYNVDPAVLYALMRQESRFKPKAKSWAGARGLMQIMPATAAYVAKDRSLKWDRNRLYDPAFNINGVGPDLCGPAPRSGRTQGQPLHDGRGLQWWANQYAALVPRDERCRTIRCSLSRAFPSSESRHYVETCVCPISGSIATAWVSTLPRSTWSLAVIGRSTSLKGSMRPMAEPNTPAAQSGR